MEKNNKRDGKEVNYLNDELNYDWFFKDDKRERKNNFLF